MPVAHRIRPPERRTRLWWARHWHGHVIVLFSSVKFMRMDVCRTTGVDSHPADRPGDQAPACHAAGRPTRRKRRALDGPETPPQARSRWYHQRTRDWPGTPRLPWSTNEWLLIAKANVRAGSRANAADPGGPRIDYVAS